MATSRPSSTASIGTAATGSQAGTFRPAAGVRYNATAQALHWVTAILMFIALPLAWAGVNLPEQTSSRDTVIGLHKSVGLTILVIVAVRLAWRASHPAPSLSPSVTRWEQRASFASHWLLYLILLGMPVSGFLLAAFGGHPTSYFGLFTIPALPRNDTARHAAAWLHVVTGQWLVYALILLHIAATAWHIVVRRDGVLERMLPPQEPAAAGGVRPPAAVRSDYPASTMQP